MMKQIIAFGASNSKNSINKKLASYVANKMEGFEITILDLNDFEMPIFSIDRENENGIPPLAYEFKNHISNSNGIVISFAEHNGSYSAAFKNIFDWISRIEKDVWNSKPMFLLATSPGGRGAKTVLQIAKSKFLRMNQNTIASFSLPSFYANFSEERGIVDESFSRMLENELKKFTDALQKTNVRR